MRRKRDKPTYFYCPKCGNRKLRSSYTDDPSIKSRYGACRRIWVCDWEASGPTAAVMSVEKTPCDCVISVPGRDAEIADYNNALDRLAQLDEPLILSWVMGNISKAHKTGLRALFVGQHLDLVRLREEEGIGFVLFFRHNTWEKDEELENSLRCRAAQHIKFRSWSLSTIFMNNRLVIFHRKPNYSSWNRPLIKTNEETDEVVAQAIELAKDLDTQFPELVTKLKTASELFNSADRELRHKVALIAGSLLTVDNYDHIKDEARFHINMHALSGEQVLQLAAALAPFRRETPAEDPDEDDEG